jgi:peptidoglycan/LPS O-acetylase OafA/YrhL
VIRPIQYLRALAALMVVWHHGLRQLPGVSDLIQVPAFGESGVDLFFVINGFIMLVTTTEKPLKPWEFFELRHLLANKINYLRNCGNSSVPQRSPLQGLDVKA